MGRRFRTQFPRGRNLERADRPEGGARPLRILLHAGQGPWDSSVAPLDEEIEGLDGDLGSTEARRRAFPAPEDARASEPWLGTRGSGTVEVPFSSKGEARPEAEGHAGRVVGTSRRAFGQFEMDREEAV